MEFREKCISKYMITTSADKVFRFKIGGVCFVFM